MINFLASMNLSKHLFFHLDYSNSGNEHMIFITRQYKQKEKFTLHKIKIPIIKIVI